MLFQDLLTQRIIIVLIVQVWPIFYGNYFAIKLLKRAKSRSTMTLSTFFILVSFTYFLANFSILLINNPFAYIFYILGIYFFVFSHCFMIIFSWVLIKLDEKTAYWKFHLIITMYAVLSSYVLLLGFFFNGIKYDSSTGWIPNFSWSFVIFNWIFILIFLVIPQINYSFKLTKVFEGVIVKRRLKMYIIAVFLELFVVFSLFLYHFWVDNQIYRTFHIIVMPITSTLSAYLIYKSFGQELE